MENTAVAKPSAGGGLGVNRAKKWQIALFPFNNAATNVYFAFYNYFTYFAIMYLTGSSGSALVGTIVSGAAVLLISTFTSIFVPLMRVFDGITDPILGGIMDKTRSRVGKFRPFMVIGNVMLALSILIMMVFFRGIPDNLSALRWVVYIVSYIIYVLGYTSQCAVTKAGQTCLTNDPQQRSQFAIWNMVGMLGSIVLINVLAGGILTNEAICPKGTISYIDSAGALQELKGAAYGPQFYNIMVPFVIILSAIYTTMAIFAIREKDKPEFWGISGETPKVKDYIDIVKKNKELRWLVLSSGFNKLASTIATSSAVAFLLFGCLMDDYNGLFIPFYALCFVFMGLFLLWGTKTGGRKGQKRAVTQFTVFAIIFYIGVTIMLALYNQDSLATALSLFSMSGGFHLTINFYTIAFIVLYGCGYGAFNCCDQMTIPMVADCTDYETYRSGNYVPGIMGTIFSLVDKIISSLQTLLLQLFIVFLVPGLNALPAESTTYLPGMKLSTIICFCIIPMVAWLITLVCMFFYKLNGAKLREIQAVNAIRKTAMAGGMSKEEALATWVTIDQVPSEFIPAVKPIIDKKTGLAVAQAKLNILDKIYAKIWGRREQVEAIPSSNAINIPEQYMSEMNKMMDNVATAEAAADAAEDLRLK